MYYIFQFLGVQVSESPGGVLPAVVRPSRHASRLPI